MLMNPNPLSALNHFTVPCAMACLLPGDEHVPARCGNAAAGPGCAVSGSGTVPPVNPVARHQPRTQKTTTPLSNHVPARAIPATFDSPSARAGPRRRDGRGRCPLLRSVAGGRDGRPVHLDAVRRVGEPEP